MNRAHQLGTRIGEALGRLLDPIIGDRLRARYAATFGNCRVCDKPLGGASRDQVCETCHAGELLALGFAEGIEKGGDA